MAEAAEVNVKTGDTETEKIPTEAGAANDDLNQEEIINWEEEATAIIKDVKTHVSEIEISRALPTNPSNIYLNICTIEGEHFCVHVSNLGFRVVSHSYNTIDADKSVPNEEEVFETPYALLDKISPRYVESFGNQLCKQLRSLQQMRTQFNEEDEEELDETDAAAAAAAKQI